MSYLSDVPSRRITLNLEKICTQCGISREQAASFRIDQMEDHLERALVYGLHGFLLCMKHTDCQERKIEVPDTWWDHFKMSCPIWIRRRFPPKMREIAVQTINNTTNVCPHLNVRVPEHGMRIHLEWMEDASL